MALPSSGQLTMAQIQTEFGGSNPASLSEYYRDGSYVTSNNTNVPTSGQISLNNFYGAQKQSNYTLAMPLSYSSLYNTSNAQQSITMPSGIQADDLIIVVQSNRMGSQNGYGAGSVPGFGNGFTSMTGATSNTSSGANPNNYNASFAPWNWYGRNSSWYVWTNKLTVSWKVASGNEGGTSIAGFCGASSSWGNCTVARWVYVLRPDYTVGSNYEIKIGGRRQQGGIVITDGPYTMDLAQYQIPGNPAGTTGTSVWQGEGNQGAMTTPANGVTVGLSIFNTHAVQSGGVPSSIIPSNAISTLVSNYTSYNFPGASPNSWFYLSTAIYTLPQSQSSVPVTFPSTYGAQHGSLSLITTW
jgi:hypothetical protein